MSFCSKCGQELKESDSFCSACGGKVGRNLNEPSTSQTISEIEYSQFVGKNEEKYLRRFKKFSEFGTDNFSATWHWPAFFFCPFWMLYRKLYLYAFIAFVLSVIPGVNVIIWIATGVSAYYLYYKDAKKKISELKASALPESLEEAFRKIGGVHGWLLKTYIAIIVIFFGVGVLAGIIVPNYNAYMKKAAEVKSSKIKPSTEAIRQEIRPQLVYEHEGNIGIITEEGDSVLLTTAGLDSYPSISDDKKYVVFVRETPGVIWNDETAKQLWIVDVDKRSERQILTADHNDEPSKNLYSFSRPLFSNDGRSIYFESSAWETSRAIHKLSLEDNSVSFVIDGSLTEIIRAGEFKDFLIVVRTRYGKEGEGRDSYYYIVRPDGSKNSQICQVDNNTFFNSFRKRCIPDMQKKIPMNNKINPAGVYDYAEEGFAGEMIVFRISTSPLTWKALITTNSTNAGAYVCGLEAIGHNEIGTDNEIQALFEVKENNARFYINFTPGGAVVEQSETSGFCGLNGQYSGDWKKSAP